MLILIRFLQCNDSMKMGTNFKRAIFDSDIHAGLVGWAQNAKRRRASSDGSGEIELGNS